MSYWSAAWGWIVHRIVPSADRPERRRTQRTIARANRIADLWHDQTRNDEQDRMQRAMHREREFWTRRHGSPSS